MVRHPVGRRPSVLPVLSGAAHRRCQRRRRRGARRRGSLIAVPPPSPVSGEEEAAVLKVAHVREELFRRVDPGRGGGGGRRSQRGGTAALPEAKTDTSVDDAPRCQATLKGPELLGLGSLRFLCTLWPLRLHADSLSLPGQTIKTISLNHSSLSVPTTAAPGAQQHQRRRQPRQNCFNNSNGQANVVPRSNIQLPAGAFPTKSGRRVNTPR